MAMLKSDHDRAKCSRCNAVGRGILKKIRALVKELEEIIIMEESEETDNEEKKVTMDKKCLLKTASFDRPLISFPEKCVPEYELEVMDVGVPVWEPRRYPSKELIGGEYCPCLCSRNNGLPEDCMRWHCRGRAGCFSSPPSCPASGRWRKTLSKQEMAEILALYSPEKLKPCGNHTVWDPACHLCRWYLNNVNKICPSLSIH